MEKPALSLKKGLWVKYFLIAMIGVLICFGTRLITSSNWLGVLLEIIGGGSIGFSYSLGMTEAYNQGVQAAFKVADDMVE